MQTELARLTFTVDWAGGGGGGGGGGVELVLVQDAARVPSLDLIIVLYIIIVATCMYSESQLS